MRLPSRFGHQQTDPTVCEIDSRLLKSALLTPLTLHSTGRCTLDENHLDAAKGVIEAIDPNEDSPQQKVASRPFWTGIPRLALYLEAEPNEQSALTRKGALTRRRDHDNGKQR